MGPEALRVAGLPCALAARGLKWSMRQRRRARPTRTSAVDGYRNLREVAAWSRELHTAVYRELQASRLPILLGGDHSLSIGSVSASHGTAAKRIVRCGGCAFFFFLAFLK